MPGPPAEPHLGCKTPSPRHQPAIKVATHSSECANNEIIRKSRHLRNDLQYMQDLPQSEDPCSLPSLSTLRTLGYPTVGRHQHPCSREQGRLCLFKRIRTDTGSVTMHLNECSSYFHKNVDYLTDLKNAHFQFQKHLYPEIPQFLSLSIDRTKVLFSDHRLNIKMPLGSSRARLIELLNIQSNYSNRHIKPLHVLLPS